MMTLQALRTLLFTLLMALPKFYADTETPAERAARMDTIAIATASATAAATCTADWQGQEWCKPVWPAAQQRELALLLVTTGFWESRFAQHVHADHCGPRECDPVKLADGTIYHRARTVWQLQYSGLITAEEWRTMNGTAVMPTFTAAYAASKVLGASRGRCAGQIASWELATLSGYAGGYTCQWSGAGPRVALYRKLQVQAARLEIGPELPAPVALSR